MLLAVRGAWAYISPSEATRSPSPPKSMPINDGKRYCVNHPAARMNRTETLKALVNIDGSSAGGTINTKSGLVVMPFVCEECGYLELYVADRTPQDSK